MRNSIIYLPVIQGYVFKCLKSLSFLVSLKKQMTSRVAIQEGKKEIPVSI